MDIKTIMSQKNRYIDKMNQNKDLDVILTSDQLRAARALINVTQHDVAKRAGISRNALNNFERNQVVPRIETLKVLRQTMELYGVEFEGTNGVRKVTERFDIERYEGPDYMRRLIAEERHEIMEGRCRSIYITNIDNTRLDAEDLRNVAGEWKNFRKKNRIDERILVREDHLFFIQPKDDYRFLPPNVAGEIPSLIFGDILAIIVWGDPVKLMLIKNPSIAETYRRQFLAQWELARPLTQKEYTKGVAFANDVLIGDINKNNS
jgi:transcriptional regulator with XRE-family HTH domain